MSEILLLGSVKRRHGKPQSAKVMDISLFGGAKLLTFVEKKYFFIVCTAINCSRMI